MNAETGLRWVLRSSAIYDGVALLLLLAMPDFLFEFFRHPRPDDPFLFRLSALPLWMAPFVYWRAAVHLEASLIHATLWLRIAGGLGIAALVLAHRPLGAGAYWSFVIGDMAWALVVWVSWRRVREERSRLA